MSKPNLTAQELRVERREGGVMDVIKFYPPGSRNAPMIVPFTEQAWNNLWQFVRDADLDSGYVAIRGKMIKEVFENLPEHLGW